MFCLILLWSKKGITFFRSTTRNRPKSNNYKDTWSMEFSRCNDDCKNECGKAGDEVDDGEGLVIKPPDRS